MGPTNREIADAFRIHERTIQRYLKLEDCSPELKDALHAGQVQISVAYEVQTKGLPLAEVIRRGLSVRQLKSLQRGKKKPEKAKDYVRLKKFKGGNFNLTVKYKAGLTDVDQAVDKLRAALAILEDVQGAESSE